MEKNKAELLGRSNLYDWGTSGTRLHKSRQI